MTGAASRRRGVRAEQAVARWLRDHGWPHARRTLAGDGRQPGDIDVHPDVCIEVKDVERSSWPSWQTQALAEAGNRRIVAVIRRTRGIGDAGYWQCRWTLDGGVTWHDSTFSHLACLIPGRYGR